MAIKGASTQTTGDRVDWDELAAENAAIVITHHETMPRKDYGNGEVAAPRCRVIVLTGSDAGTVYEDVLLLKGGLRAKAGEPGDDTVGRVAKYEHNGRKGLIGLNDEQEGDLEKAEKALAAADKKEPAGVSGKTSSSKGDDKYDGDPDF